MLEWQSVHGVRFVCDSQTTRMVVQSIRRYQLKRNYLRAAAAAAAVTHVEVCLSG